MPIFSISKEIKELKLNKVQTLLGGHSTTHPHETELLFCGVQE
jgi:hypothetical protein